MYEELENEIGTEKAKIIEEEANRNEPYSLNCDYKKVWGKENSIEISERTIINWTNLDVAKEITQDTDSEDGITITYYYHLIYNKQDDDKFVYLYRHTEANRPITCSSKAYKFSVNKLDAVMRIFYIEPDELENYVSNCGYCILYTLHN